MCLSELQAALLPLPWVWARDILQGSAEEHATALAARAIAAAEWNPSTCYREINPKSKDRKLCLSECDASLSAAIAVYSN
jgi:hypothetical protein